MTELERAQQELADATVPTPEWLEEDLTPAAVLLWLWEAAKTGLRVATAAAVALDEPGDDDQPVVNDMLNGCSAALAGYTVALVALGVLPPEAEQALDVGIKAH